MPRITQLSARPAQSLASDGAPTHRSCQAWRVARRVCLTRTFPVLALMTCQVPLPGCALDRRLIGHGLNGPRGLALGPDGALYVAETGTAAAGSRISRIDAHGVRHTVVEGLPYATHAGTEETGAAAVAFRRGELYILQGYGSAAHARALLRLGPTGLESVADFAAFEEANDPDGAPGGSNPFALLYDAAADVFYVTDAGANDLLRVHPDGTIEVMAVWRDNQVPTGLARGPDGALYVALFSPFPHPAGQGHIDRVQPNGALQVAAADLTMPIGVAFDSSGVMYVLEFAGALELRPRLGFRPNSGRLLRLDGPRRQVLLDRLQYPTAVLAGSGDTLLLSIFGAFSPPGSGAILRIAPCR